MAKPLDGVALQAYFRRLGYQRETQDLLSHIRNSPPSRTPGARRGNMPLWYPSKKMHCIIKAESAKVEFAFLLLCGHFCTLDFSQSGNLKSTTSLVPVKVQPDASSASLRSRDVSSLTRSLKDVPD